MANNYSHLQKHYILNYFGLQNNYFGIRAKFIPVFILTLFIYYSTFIVAPFRKDNLQVFFNLKNDF